MNSPDSSPNTPHTPHHSTATHQNTSNTPHYTESQYNAYNPFKANEYQILKQDKYAKDKHLYNEKQLEPRFLSVLMEVAREADQEYQQRNEAHEQHSPTQLDPLHQDILLQHLESYQQKFKQMKQKVKEVEKTLKQEKQKTTQFFKGAAVKPERILPQIQQNKQKLDFLKDLTSRCDKLTQQNDDLRSRIEQCQDDATLDTSLLHENSLLHEVMLSRSMSMLPLKVHSMEDHTQKDEIEIKCTLNEFDDENPLHLLLILDRMNGKLKSVNVYEDKARKRNITRQYSQIIDYSIQKNDLQFLVGELYASIGENSWS